MPEVPRAQPFTRPAPLGTSFDSGADSRLSVTVSRLNRHVVVVTAAGEVDVTTADALRAAMVDCLDEMADGCVAVLDLSQVSFLDSSGLHVLVRAHQRAQTGRTVWRLCGMRPIVAQVVELTHVDRLFKIHRNLAEALTWTAPR